MSAQANAAVVRRLYEAFDKRDAATLARLIAEDAKWHVPGASPVSGTHTPRDAVFAFFADLAKRSEGTFHASVQDIYASDQGAVALAKVTGQRAGRRYDSTYLLRFAIRGGRISEAWLHNWDQAAFEQFWG